MLASKIKKTKTRYGEMHYYSDDQFIGYALEKYGEYSEGETALWRKLLKPGASVYEVGANIGALTLALADIVGPEGKIVAFEPQPENADLLRKNIEANCSGDHIAVAEVAIGDHDEKVKIPLLSELQTSNYGDVAVGSGECEVHMTTLDLPWLFKVDFIKIDVQGMEAEVLKGARDTIKQSRPLLYVENDQFEKSEALKSLISDLGYRMYEHQPLLWDDNNFRKAPITDRPIISLNMLCVPTERVAEFEDITCDLKIVVSKPKRVGKTGWAGIVRLGGVGDNLIAASVLRPLKRQGYKIDVITQEPQACVFENNPFVDKLSIKVGARDLPQNDPMAWQLYWKTRANEYDVFANLSHSCENLNALFPASTAFWWPATMRRSICDRSYLESVHDIVGVAHEFGPLFFPTDEEREQARHTRKKYAKGRKIVGWCITGTRVDKVYPGAPQVVARMIKELDVAVMLFGAPPPARDVTYAEQIQEIVRVQNGGVENLLLGLSPSGQDSWPIRRILTQAIDCDLVIGPDTGPMWAVAMEPMPKIMLHSHASPTNIVKHWVKTVSLGPNKQRVPCWPCHLLHDSADTCRETQRMAGMTVNMDALGAACIADISVETIIRTAAKLLHQGESK